MMQQEDTLPVVESTQCHHGCLQGVSEKEKQAAPFQCVSNIGLLWEGVTVDIMKGKGMRD